MSSKVQTNNKINKKYSQRKRQYAIGKKIPLSILLSLVAPLTVCFFGPFETYCANIEEFTFSLGDFLPYTAALGGIAALLIFAILMLLDGRAFDIAVATVTCLTVMLFAQRYYLNFGVNALAGDGVGVSEAEPYMVVINTVIWLAVFVGIFTTAILLKRKNIAPFFVTTALLLIAIFVTQTVGFAALSVSTDAYVPVTDRGENASEDDSTDNAGKVMLTYENLSELSLGKNIVFFLIDRFDVRYFEKLQKNSPEYLDSLDGFTFYNDYTSLYCRTYPAIASILTGKENDFEGTRLNYFKNIYKDGGHMRALADAGYDVNVYTESYYAYDDGKYMLDYVDNLSGVHGYEIDDNISLSRDILRLSLSTCLPFVAKDIVGDMSTPDFNAHAVYDSDEPVYDADMKNVYEYITGNEFSTVKSDGQFTFIHIYGCHTPIKYNLDWQEASEKEQSNTEIALKQSLMIISEYIAEMKRLGLYEDATIIITGDHPAALSDTKLIGETGRSDDNGTRVTAMLFKRAGESGTSLKTSTAQISQDELWATIYESEGLTYLKEGDSFFDIAEGEERVRRYLFEWAVYLDDGGRADEIVEYRITGSARDRENWEIAERTVVGRIYK